MITAFALLFCFQGEGYFERVSPYIFNGDVRSLPRMAGWKPGDPLFEIPRRSGNDALVEPQNVPAQIDPLLSPQRIYDQSGLLGGLQILQNVAGQANTGSNVPDANGQAGLTYYIQVVNRFQTSPLRFGTAVQIYNKSDMSLAAGPFVLDTLGSGDCSAGLGDPCVIWDYQAERWIISEMSRTKLSLCVYVSQTADPLSGGWFHYSFNPPNALDYPHIAVWGDSYIVTTNENKQAIYALERNAMLAGQSAAAQRFEVPVLPAFNFNALTPANAEGLNTIVDGPALLMNHRDDEAHNPGTNDPSQDFLDLYTLDINWADPTQSQLAGPTSIPIGEFDSHLCGYLVANVCFPQPGTGQLLDPVREVIMNRLVYRQFEDYASLVGSFVTDVDGTDHGGVRWFELRKTNGFWFLYQEGTYAPDSAHRWISSSSVDGDGNILLGYNITDASSIFPGLRFNGRYAQDPPGVFTLGENNIVEGTAAANTSRWGDYAGASLDPEDERTFWFTGQYQAALWATRIISLRLCDPPPAPTNLQAVANGTNRIDLTWTSANGKVAIYRAEGTCPAPGAFQKIAGPLTAASYSDLTASGGTTYAYFVKAIDDSTGCPSPASGCASASTTGPCLLPPLFDGLATLTDAEDLQCQLQLSWSPATSRCGGGVTYAIYRSESPDFSPQPANLLTSCLAATNYTDTQVSFGTTYYYIVRAEDDSGNGAGPCGGNQDANQIALAGSPHGPITLHLDDDFESGSSAWVAEVGPMQGGSTTIWVLDTNQSHSPTHAFFAPDVAGVRDQLIRPTATFNLPAADPAILEFWKLSQTETGFDGVVLEFSVDGGTDWFDILDGGDGIPANPNRILQNGYNSVLAGGGNPLGGRSAWTGSRPWEKVVVDCSEMAGSALKLRWRYGSDLDGAGTGFWLDDVRLQSQSSCTLTCLIAEQLPQWPTTTMLDLVACINLL